MPIVAKTVRQRSELTFKANRDQGRHGWLRLTPAYSIRLVEDILDNAGAAHHLLDPFSGTATTTLAGCQRGVRSTSFDINPFLVWLGNVKVARYSSKTLDSTEKLAQRCIDELHDGKCAAAPPPPIHNIERWWSHNALDFLCRLKGRVARARRPARDLLLVAFCRSVIALSNADFGHQSMSFKDRRKNPRQLALLEVSHSDRFLHDVAEIVDSAAARPRAPGRVLLQDARSCSPSDEPYDLIITSPPYPNRMSYIRELRPYMYWLDYLDEAREAGELDWQAIGGTWGIATSRLHTWKRTPGVPLPGYLAKILDDIAGSHPKNGILMANYVARYFEDMMQHLRSLRTVVGAGAKLHYIIGNSKFYDVMVPAEKVYVDMMRAAGFNNVASRVVRKRNSKKELYEFDVSATA